MTGILCAIAGATYSAAVVARTAKTVTAVGNAQVDTAQSQFGGASALFDGTGDRLEISGDLSQTGDFTYEFWFRAADTISNQGLLAVGNESTGRENIYLNGNNPRLNLYAGADNISSSTNISINTWYHLAVVRSATTVTMYLAGSNVGSYTDSTQFGNSTGLYIADIAGGAISLNGHIDEVRVSNIARYTAAFTPSTTPFVNDANTLLLLHCNGTDATTVFTDDVGTNLIPRTPNTVTAYGNAQVDTAQSAFGGASALFDGTGDYLQTAGNADFDLASTDFTVEGWFRKSVSLFGALIGNYEFNTRGGFSLFTWSNNSLLIGSRNSADTGLQFYQSANNVSTDSQFNHFAVCRSGLNMQVYCEGTRVINRTDFYIKNWATASNAKITVGRSAGSAGGTWSDVNYEMNGHIDEIRVSKITRYSGATYTEPTAAFTNDRDTLLLVHCNGTDASTTFTDDNA